MTPPPIPKPPAIIPPITPTKTKSIMFFLVNTKSSSPILMLYFRFSFCSFIPKTMFKAAKSPASIRKTIWIIQNHAFPHLIPRIDLVYLLPMKRFISIRLVKIPKKTQSFLHCLKWPSSAHFKYSASLFSSSVSCNNISPFCNSSFFGSSLTWISSALDWS